MAATLHIGDVLGANARLFPERLGARDLSRAMTFRQWNARARRLANALLGLGLRKGDRIAILAYNCVEWMEIYAATAKPGIVGVPINFRLLAAAKSASSSRIAEARALIVQDDLLGPGGGDQSQPPGREAYIHFGAAAAPAGYRSYEGPYGCGPATANRRGGAAGGSAGC